MKLRCIALTTSLFVVGCNNHAKEASMAAAARSAEAVEIDQRAKIIAEDLVQKAASDADQKQQAAEKQKIDARKQLQQDTMDHPGNFLEPSKLQMVEQGKRHLISIVLTNSSKFSVTDIHGTIDFHGDDSHGNDVGVVAQLPVQLTGAIAPGASMVFSEQQNTLSGASVQLSKPPTSVSFTITGVKVGSEGLDATPAAAVGAADGGSP
jgi:hypothetical protein